MAVESIQKTDLENKTLSLLEPVLSPLGFGVVDLDCRVGSRSLLRLFVERVSTSLATIDDCAEVSRAVAPVLEAQELFPGPYDLEVSSPGLDRRLRTAAHFAANVGAELKLQLKEAVQGSGLNLRGVLLGVSEAGIQVAHSGREVTIPLGSIVRAQKVWVMKAN